MPSQVRHTRPIAFLWTGGFMDRRRFLRIAVGSIIVVPAGRFLVQCASDDGSSSAANPDQPAAPPTVSSGNAVYSSSFAQAHYHTFSIDMSAFSSPPSGGVSGSTSVFESHSHTVSVTAAMLASVAVGDSILVSTSVVTDHQHVLTLVKVSSTGTGGDMSDAGAGGGGGTGGGAGAGGGGYGYGGGGY